MKGRPLLSAFLLGAALASVAQGEALAKAALRLVDDRRQPIHSSLEVCFQVGTRSVCSALPTGGSIEPPADWASVRVEGPEHGPVSAMRGNLKPGPEGPPVLLVPRKADLEVVTGGKDDHRLALPAGRSHVSFPVVSERGAGREVDQISVRRRHSGSCGAGGLPIFTC